MAAKLREKTGPAEAGQSAAGNPGEPRSRLKVFISTAPAWAGFDFSEGGTPPAAIPFQPGRSARGRPSRDFLRRGPRGPFRGPPIMPPTPVKLWEKMVTGGLALKALFAPGAEENWPAVAIDGAHADPLPCGLRISIVRVAWEVGGQTHE